MSTCYSFKNYTGSGKNNKTGTWSKQSS